LNNIRNYVIIDLTNALFRTFYAHQIDDLDQVKQLAFSSTLMLLRKNFNKFNATKLLLACDRPNNWRKQYTKDIGASLTGVIYKGNRRKSLLDDEKEKYEKFIEFISDFEELMTEHTSTKCFAKEGLEADDIISQLVQQYHKEANITIVSTDKDFIQLLKFPNVVLFDPLSGKQRYHDDLGYFMFEKNIRGDRTDNVRSAFPRVRSKRLKKVYYGDNYEYLALMKESITFGDQTFTVEELYHENNLLMNLTAQPECVKNKMIQCVEEGMSRQNKFSHFKFLRFCGKHNLDVVVERLPQYMDMLSA